MCTEAGQRNTLQQFPLPENKTQEMDTSQLSPFTHYTIFFHA